MKRGLLFILFILLLQFSSASISVFPKTIEQNEYLKMDIKINNKYDSDIYFYKDGNPEVYYIKDLKCGEFCTPLSLVYEWYTFSDKYSQKIYSSLFETGEYQASYYVPSQDRWYSDTFTVINPLLKCSDGTKQNTCSYSKPIYCDENLNLVNNCNKCGCSTTDLICMPNGNCEIPTCSDGTQKNTCSSSKPTYCDENLNLINNCGECGCPEGVCQINGGCVISQLGSNKKNLNFYSDKEAFLVSDLDWREVLPFVPVAVWTEGTNVKKYPFLVYHDESDSSVDLDSSVYFLQQYNPNKLTIIGETSQEISNVLVNSLKDSVSEHQMQQINNFDYLSYWETFDKVVYVEEDYELALLASTYASLINAPLIIQNTLHDSSNIFSKREVICVGNVNPDGSSCTETYNLEQLQNKYYTETKTDKLILINPLDWEEYTSSGFSTELSDSYIRQLYTKTSLMAPIIASAKHELILSTYETDYEKIDAFIGQKISELNPNYLTVIGASDVIPHKLDYRGSNLFGVFGWALDPAFYADVTGDNSPDVAVGRIAGISSSDVSSYISRVLFYEEFPRTINTKFMATSFFGSLALVSDYFSNLFLLGGYNSISKSTAEEAPFDFLSEEDWKNQDLIVYLDHGMSSWSGIFASKIPKLDNTLIFSASCLTISRFSKDSFWANSIRQGSIGYYGSTTVTGLNTNHLNMLGELYGFGSSKLGFVLKNKWSKNLMHGMTTLIGDPTFDFNPPYQLDLGIDNEICYTKDNNCMTNKQCCNDLQCQLFSCKDCFELNDGCLVNTDCCSNYQCSWFSCSDCHLQNEGCIWDTDCCENTGGCNMFECGLREQGESCLSNDDCSRSLRCLGFSCKKPYSRGHSCLFNNACASNKCRWVSTGWWAWQGGFKCA